jgi:hypothetical protein
MWRTMVRDGKAPQPIRLSLTCVMYCWLSLKTDPPFAFKIDPPSVGDYT